jgi:hypothetical protein
VRSVLRPFAVTRKRRRPPLRRRPLDALRHARHRLGPQKIIPSSVSRSSFSAISASVRNIFGTATMRPDRDWVDIGTLIVLGAAFFAAAWAAVESERLATATLDATVHSDFAARAQHLDTLAALQKAEQANTNAKNALVSANRAWVVSRSVKLPGSLQAGQDAIFTLYYDNPGREPARNTGTSDDAKSFSLMEYHH